MTKLGFKSWSLKRTDTKKPGVQGELLGLGRRLSDCCVFGTHTNAQEEGVHEVQREGSFVLLLFLPGGCLFLSQEHGAGRPKTVVASEQVGKADPLGDCRVSGLGRLPKQRRQRRKAEEQQALLGAKSGVLPPSGAPSRPANHLEINKLAQVNYHCFWHRM